MNNAENMRLSADRISNPRRWERQVRSAVRRSRTLQLAADDLRVSRETLRRYCRELGLPEGTPGRKKS